MDISEHITQIEGLLGMELKDVKLLESNKVSKLNLDLEHPDNASIFYNETNIVLTDTDQFNKFKSAFAKFEEVLKIEMVPFNLYLYVGNYVNCSELKNIIGG